jgi:hypothetical protein
MASGGEQKCFILIGVMMTGCGSGIGITSFLVVSSRVVEQRAPNVLWMFSEDLFFQNTGVAGVTHACGAYPRCGKAATARGLAIDRIDTGC